MRESRVGVSGLAQLQIGNVRVPEEELQQQLCREVRLLTGEDISLTVTAENGAGARAQNRMVFNVDNNAPEVEITSPQELVATQNPWVRAVDGRVRLTGNFSYGLCSVQTLTINGFEVSDFTDESFEISLPVDGEHSEHRGYG